MTSARGQAGLVDRWTSPAPGACSPPTRTGPGVATPRAGHASPGSRRDCYPRRADKGRRSTAPILHRSRTSRRRCAGPARPAYPCALAAAIGGWSTRAVKARLITIRQADRVGDAAHRASGVRRRLVRYRRGRSAVGSPPDSGSDWYWSTWHEGGLAVRRPGESRTSPVATRRETPVTTSRMSVTVVAAALAEGDGSVRRPHAVQESLALYRLRVPYRARKSPVVR
jgi:hypothetical protein